MRTPSKWQTRQPIYRTSVARWRRYEPWLGPLRELVDDYKKIVRAETGRDFPEDPREQLDGAITAVFASWNTPRARTYRRTVDSAMPCSGRSCRSRS